MRSRTRQSIKRSLCGLLAVLMSMQGAAVASNAFARVTAATDAAPVVAAATDSEDMPCHDMMMADESIVPADTAADEDCDGDCCGPDHGCGMAYCMAGNCLPASVSASHQLPYAAAAVSEFPSPVLGRLASAHGPPLRPPIA